MYSYKLKIYDIADVSGNTAKLIPETIIVELEAEDDFDMENQLQGILKDKYKGLRYIGYNYDILIKVKVV